MGAWFTTQTATGKTPAEAYAKAIADATAYNGHQDGYSGAINSKAHGFTLITLPPRFTFSKFQRLLEDYNDATSAVSEYASRVRDYRPGGFFADMKGAKGNLRKAEADLTRAKKTLAKVEARIPADLAWKFEQIAATYYDKWEAPLAVEIKGVEAKAYAAHTTKRRGEKIYVFFGYAPS